LLDPMAGKIVLMQALHDEDDRSVFLVVQTWRTLAVNQAMTRACAPAPTLLLPP
jgi:hypothetical protein